MDRTLIFRRWIGLRALNSIEIWYCGLQCRLRSTGVMIQCQGPFHYHWTHQRFLFSLFLVHDNAKRSLGAERPRLCKAQLNLVFWYRLYRHIPRKMLGLAWAPSFQLWPNERWTVVFIKCEKHTRYFRISNKLLLQLHLCQMNRWSACQRLFITYDKAMYDSSSSKSSSLGFLEHVDPPDATPLHSHCFQPSHTRRKQPLRQRMETLPRSDFCSLPIDMDFHVLRNWSECFHEVMVLACLHCSALLGPQLY